MGKDKGQANEGTAETAVETNIETQGAGAVEDQGRQDASGTEEAQGAVVAEAAAPVAESVQGPAGVTARIAAARQIVAEGKDPRAALRKLQAAGHVLGAVRDDAVREQLREEIASVKKDAERLAFTLQGAGK